MHLGKISSRVVLTLKLNQNRTVLNILEVFILFMYRRFCVLSNIK